MAACPLPACPCSPARLQVAHALQGECSWVAGALPESCPGLPLALLGALLAKIEKPFKQRLGVAMAASAGGWGWGCGGELGLCLRSVLSRHRLLPAFSLQLHACMSPHLSLHMPCSCCRLCDASGAPGAGAGSCIRLCRRSARRPGLCGRRGGGSPGARGLCSHPRPPAGACGGGGTAVRRPGAGVPRGGAAADCRQGWAGGWVGGGVGGWCVWVRVVTCCTF